MRERSLLIVNWRDTTNPEGGGSERYVEEVASGLAVRGWTVTVLAMDGMRVDRLRFIPVSEGETASSAGGRADASGGAPDGLASSGGDQR